MDSGCGSGLDIPYLRSQGYTVYGYDAEVKQLLEPFTVHSWQELDEPGATLQGGDKHGHFFTVLAGKY
ncbi:class I SAM-dependent methyltransferase [Gilvimarinus polysaccharolyticus]|uniref:hypothetical protein n=1 Tax=Gilvimarinus polysaccharolyticus TaxID=863921 RepID=UPI000673C439|nr:hypothetical protein [Gilvimarinus polysaccharolyticus]